MLYQTFPPTMWILWVEASARVMIPKFQNHLQVLQLIGTVEVHKSLTFKAPNKYFMHGK